MTTTVPAELPEALRPIQRYKIGYSTDEWGMSSSTPGAIRDASGSWVRYADHVTALAAGQATAAPAQPAAQQGAAYAALPTHSHAGRVYEEGFLIGTCPLYTADKMRASHGQAPAQPAPATQKLKEQICISDTNQSAACAVGNVGTTSDAQTTRSTHDAPAPQQAGEVSESIEQLAVARYKVVPAHESMFHRWAVVAGDGAQQLYIGREVECENMTRKFAGAFLDGAFLALQNAAPQPSPTAQAAESVPAIQGETNVQLDTDPNTAAPGQQRDVARSVALGQPMGHGPNQVAGHLGAQGDKLLTVAERNIRSFLRSAHFKSESDREAALNCVDVLWHAARAPADSVTAPAGSAVAGQDVKYALAHADTAADLLMRAHEQAPETWRGWYDDALVHIDISRKALASLASLPTPPAQAADSVLEDAARYRWLRDSTIIDGAINDELYVHVDSSAYPGRWALTGTELDGAVDAARKQGANHD